MWHAPFGVTAQQLCTAVAPFHGHAADRQYLYSFSLVLYAPRSSTDVTVEAGQTYARILQGPLVMNKGAAALYVVDNVLLPPQAAMDMLLSSTTASTTPAPDKSVATPSPSSGPAIAPTAHSSAASSTFSWAALVGMLLATLL